MRKVTREELVAAIHDEADECENANYHALCAGMHKLADAVAAAEKIGYFAFATFDEEVREFIVRDESLTRCQNSGGHCVLQAGHKSECIDRNGWPARWSDPTYQGDGAWGA